MLRIPQSSSITGASPSDILVSYPGLSLGSLTSLQRCSRCILQPQLTGQPWLSLEEWKLWIYVSFVPLKNWSSTARKGSAKRLYKVLFIFLKMIPNKWVSFFYSTVPYSVSFAHQIHSFGIFNKYFHLTKFVRWMPEGNRFSRVNKIWIKIKHFSQLQILINQFR